MPGELFSPIQRYDVWCAFCVDGRPTMRYRGKGACAKCQAAFAEASFPSPRSAELTIERLRSLIRYLLGVGWGLYPIPLWERVWQARFDAPAASHAVRKIVRPRAAPPAPARPGIRKVAVRPQLQPFGPLIAGYAPRQR